MVRDAILGVLAQIDRETLSKNIGIPVSAINTELSRLSYISARVEFEKGEIDFKVVLPTDTPEEAEEKFLAYLDTEKMGAVVHARDEIGKLDEPFYVEYAPDPPTEKN